MKSHMLIILIGGLVLWFTVALVLYQLLAKPHYMPRQLFLRNCLVALLIFISVTLIMFVSSELLILLSPCSTTKEN